MTDSQLATAVADHSGDPVIWLGTVSPSSASGHARPTIRPVWFVVAEGCFVLFSSPGAAKVRHVARNPHVVLTFHTDPRAERVRVIDGLAEIDRTGPPASATSGFLDKYEHLYAEMDYTRSGFDASFSARIIITPTRTWEW